MSLIQDIDALQRINVIGTSGSGKSTFSKRLASLLELPYVQMDEVFWKPDWQESSDEEFFPKLEKILSNDAWVLDGNYTRTTHIKWVKVQMVIWLDYSFPKTVYRVMKRSVVRAVSGEEIWEGTGNRESFTKHFFDRDSIIWWAVKTYFPNRRKYGSIFGSKEFPHIEFIRLRNQKEADLFLKSVEKKRL